MAATAPGIDSQDRPRARKGAALMHGANTHLLPTHAGPLAKRCAPELFRATVRSLARDATQALLDVRLADDVPSSTADQLHLVHHYLDYLVRLCDGRV
jgi:hypothetical protein